MFIMYVYDIDINTTGAVLNSKINDDQTQPCCACVSCYLCCGVNSHISPTETIFVPQHCVRQVFENGATNSKKIKVTL